MGLTRRQHIKCAVTGFCIAVSFFSLMKWNELREMPLPGTEADANNKAKRIRASKLLLYFVHFALSFFLIQGIQQLENGTAGPPPKAPA